ncbi:type VI secretion system membrane subunit TssM [Chromobacterium subtsugae]|uniref:Type VI secretion system membrane subunit TssM n=1 Tax=Chromobacterium subtsugae TaxID=251747 RepID=A0ABS7FLW9_9NEIS|nr:MULTISPECIES: type VI secretion system membrane subunit TssM [Chromobacterium]KUM03188.1 type VI secretion protein [Chromobacterium subtsugae]KZE84182.1 type VI secretion protein [Chromobacterium sp. F49]MBW7569192.1 type VI secretion system membrane subunit TssM [Chromobacterium subtsugae]MBW8290308.1 type VI secretion system membrane subunit TssM [Chromobacterium subtsugae]OBU84445.1 type VI secretion protein [Chromobacterium subtsugae]
MFNKGWLRNAKVASAIGFLILIALIWWLGPWLGLKSLEARLGWIVVVMIVWVLALLVGQVLARRAGGLLEGMLRRQADEAVINASADKRAEVTLLRQRMLGAIDTLKKSNIGNARGSAALYELPWYMIIGHPAAGKSSAILQSGLSFPFSDKSGIQGVGGTRNCDWFFSTEGVLLDTAGRYATESEDRGEWLAFLKLLKQYRAKAPVNGIMVAISLPELAQHNSEGFVLYARQVRERIHEVCNTFGLMVPIYLVFTKLDLLGGFAQFFNEAGEEERSRVWGATLSADQGTGFDASAVVSQQFEQLYRGLVQMGEEQLSQARGDAVKSAHFAFPIEFHGLQEAVVKFVRLLFEEDPYHSRPLLRGFYFTSALQEGVPRIVTAGRVQGQFDLSAGGLDKHQAPASYSYFLRGLFREVLFPDQHLIFQQTKPSGSRWRLAGMIAGVVSLAAVAGLWTWSFVGNQQLIAQVSAERAQAQKLAASGQLYDRLKGLLILQNRLEELQNYRRNGEPWQIGMGLYQGEELERNLRKAYFAGVKDVMLRPVQKNLETTLAALKPGVPQPVAVSEPPKPQPKPEAKPEPKPQPAKPIKQYKPRPKGHALPNINLSALELPQRATTAKLDASAPAIGGETAGKPQNPQQLDVGYNALKTYLMLHEQRRMEEAQLADQLPRYWRPWLESQRGEYPVNEVMGQAEKLVAFYVSQIKEPDLPLIDNDPKVVADARDVLRGSFKRLSAQERVFSEIKARANTRFAPLTVARILDNRDMDIMASSQMVEGAYTREAWNTYVRAAIDEASKGEIRSDDWVLASSSQDNLGKDGDAEKNRAALEALYRAQYIAAWHKFLQGVVVRDITNPAQSASAMTRLSDKQNSPIRLILARAAQETAWDNPSELNRSLETAKRSVLEKTTELFKGADSPADAKSDKQFGVVGAQFAGVAALVKGDNPPINGYLDQLAKLKVKMAAIATTDEPGPQARTALQSTLNGSGSELGDTLSYVDNTLLNGATPDTIEMVRPMLVRPLSQSYSALLGPVAQDINQAWANEVLPQWKQLAGKYPFSDSSSSASVADINRFVKANDGTLDKFVNKYLNGLVQKKGDSLVPRAWGNQGVRFNPEFLTGVSRLMALANSQLQDGENSRFELQPLPTPGLSETVLSIDGQELRYRNGPQPWQPFNWPGSGGGEGARIQVVNYAGASTVVGNQSGRMGLMRLLASAKVQDGGDGSAQLSWNLPKGSGAEAQTVRFNFRMLGGVNPLQLNRLYKLTLPERVTL